MFVNRYLSKPIFPIMSLCTVMRVSTAISSLCLLDWFCHYTALLQFYIKFMNDLYENVLNFRLMILMRQQSLPFTSG